MSKSSKSSKTKKGKNRFPRSSPSSRDGSIFFLGNVTRNRVAIEVEKKKIRNKKLNPGSKGRTPPFRRLTCILCLDDQIKSKIGKQLENYLKFARKSCVHACIQLASADQTLWTVNHLTWHVTKWNRAINQTNQLHSPHWKLQTIFVM